MRVSPLDDGRALAGLTDITAAVLARRQLAEQEERLRQRQKLEAVGTLAGGVAHDFNNLLTAIMGSIELCQLRLAADHPVREGLQVAMKAALRARELVRRVLAFSRHAEPRREWIRLGPLATETVTLLKTFARDEVRFEIDIPETLPALHADSAQLHQVLMNLGTNSVQAMRGRLGRLIIRACRTNVDDDLRARLPELRVGPHVRVDIEDNGPGIAPDIQTRVFDPFFTTKPLGEGTGLGLSVVHGIMRRHDGAVTLDSQPGRGTVFRLYFPVTPATTPLPPSQDSEPTPGRGQCVLLIDDEPVVARVATEILRHLGYRVRTHTVPEEAWADYAAAPEDYAVVVCDLAMPGVDGLELLARMRTVRPRQPFVLMSGFFSDSARRRAELAGVSAMLPKPLGSDVLGAVVARVLDQNDRDRGNASGAA